MKMDEIKNKYTFDWSETWFLDTLNFDDSMNLEICLIGGKKEPVENLFVADINLGPVCPIFRDPKKRVIFRFIQPIAFQRLDESHASERGGSYTGQRFAIYNDSEYLRYFAKVSFGITDESIKHYCFTCADDIVDVLSSHPPEIIIK
jgi:hypothetical protein